MARRATIVVVKNEKVLLMRGKGQRQWSFPGGQIETGESVINTAIRELEEEVGLAVTAVKRLDKCDFTNDLNDHKVCFMQTNDEPSLQESDISDFTWWDMKEPIPIFEHVNYILDCIKSPGVTN
jgi:ADP-ribose pyrophosphatase YjhB (NUDIX family)